MVKQEDGSVLYAVYGTLRKGCPNNVYFQNKDSEYLGTIKTEPKFTLFGKGAGFPFLAEGGNTEVTVEIYRAKSDYVIEGVNSLEGYRGVGKRNWYDVTQINTPWGVANAFTMNKLLESENEDFIIKTGDWKNQN